MAQKIAVPQGTNSMSSAGHCFRDVAVGQDGEQLLIRSLCWRLREPTETMTRSGAAIGTYSIAVPILFVHAADYMGHFVLREG